MKLALSNGQQAKVGVRFGEKEIKGGSMKIRTTELMVTLPSGETLTVTVACDSRGQFCKSDGRYAAVLKLFGDDNEQAFDRLVEEIDQKTTAPWRKSVIKKTAMNEENGSLQQAVRPYYKIDRPLRTLIFKVVCPEFSRSDPKRVEQREKSLYERLHRKYGQEGGMAEISKPLKKTTAWKAVENVIGSLGADLKQAAK